MQIVFNIFNRYLLIETGEVDEDNEPPSVAKVKDQGKDDTKDETRIRMGFQTEIESNGR